MSDDNKYRKFTKIDQIIHVLGVALVQIHGPHKDIKLFGQEGKTAVQKEMQQHHNIETYYPVDPSKLTLRRNEKSLNRHVCNVMCASQGKTV